MTAKLPNGSFRFDELSKESPEDLMDTGWGEAFDYAEDLGDGAWLMNKNVYDSFKPHGIDLDVNTFSWLDGGDRGDARKHGGRRYFGSNGIAVRSFSRTRNAEEKTRHPLGGARYSVEV